MTENGLFFLPATRNKLQRTIQICIQSQVCLQKLICYVIQVLNRHNLFRKRFPKCSVKWFKRQSARIQFFNFITNILFPQFQKKSYYGKPDINILVDQQFSFLQKHNYFASHKCVICHFSHSPHQRNHNILQSLRFLSNLNNCTKSVMYSTSSLSLLQFIGVQTTDCRVVQ